MTEQQPQIQPGAGTDAAEDTGGSADEARAVGGTEAELAGAELAGTVDPAQPADEASSPA